jgi:type II secretory pathway pseudopilin PulG
MRCIPSLANRAVAGFTLAEVLAALTFMAIVIPVAIEGVRIASRAGVVAERKGEAVLVAERILNENIVTGQWEQSSPRGIVQDGARTFRWQLRNELWDKDAMRLVTVIVTFDVQGQEHDVRLSTLMDNSSGTSDADSSGNQPTGTQP